MTLPLKHEDLSCIVIYEYRVNTLVVANASDSFSREFVVRN